MKTSSEILAVSLGCIACCAAPVALGVLTATGITAIALESLEWAGIAGVLAVGAFLVWRLARPGASPASCGCDSAPIACTLSGDDFKARTAWIRDLARTSLIESHRDDLVLHLTYDASAAPRVREMVEKEQACCAFMRFETREDPCGIHVTITAPESARAAAGDLFGHFAPESARLVQSSKEKETIS